MKKPLRPDLSVRIYGWNFPALRSPRRPRTCSSWDCAFLPTKNCEQSSSANHSKPRSRGDERNRSLRIERLPEQFSSWKKRKLDKVKKWLQESVSMEPHCGEVTALYLRLLHSHFPATSPKPSNASSTCRTPWRADFGRGRSTARPAGNSPVSRYWRDSARWLTAKSEGWIDVTMIFVGNLLIVLSFGQALSPSLLMAYNF